MRRLHLACAALFVAALAAPDLPWLTAAAAAVSGGCPNALFTGTIARDDDAANDQTAGSVKSSKVRSALAVDFGTARNTTVYLSDAKLDPADIGSTVEAAPGSTIATIFLRPKSGDLAAGKKVALPADQISVVVDTGGGAHASTGGAAATAKVLSFTDNQVCFSIDYRDDLQRVKGKVRAKLVRPS